jgi:hypothetical protein
MDDATVDSLVTGLVREFLFRRGLTGVLRTFDEETGYERGSALSSTRELVESLRLSTLYKRNASSSACSLLASSPRVRTRRENGSADSLLRLPLLPPPTPAPPVTFHPRRQPRRSRAFSKS